MAVAILAGATPGTTMTAPEERLIQQAVDAPASLDVTKVIPANVLANLSKESQSLVQAMLHLQAPMQE